MGLESLIFLLVAILGIYAVLKILLSPFVPKSNGCCKKKCECCGGNHD